MEELLTRVWDGVSETFASFGRGVERSLTSLFGSSNARYLRKLQPLVAAIAALEPTYQAMTDSELKEQTFKFRKRLAAGETLDDILVEAYAICREAGRRVLGMRHFDVQMMGGIVLHRGNIAEMVTGEGKTLVATLPAYLNAIEGKGVHVVTVNDYLARRDMEWMGPLYMSLGLSVGAIQSNMETAPRQQAYDSDITYGTNNEFGFDYLRDNMRPAARGDARYPKQYQQVQNRLHFAIIDEVDNILVDEARTPLIISGPAHDDVTRYARADRIARQLKKDVHFEVKEKEHTSNLTDEGVRAAEQLAGVESFYTAGNMEWPHLIDNALKAHWLYKRDVNYMIQGDEIIIVDEFTGRAMPGRNWSDGLHQAVEAKEGVRIKEENQTLATITLQNFFKLYNKICGMTGTAMTEANEFWKVYKLDVMAIPTNRGLQRINHPDVIYRSEREKYTALCDDIERMHKWDVLDLDDRSEVIGKIIKESDDSIEVELADSREHKTVAVKKVKKIARRGRPILVGTVSIERSEKLSSMLDKRGVKHEVLNAKHHQREAEIVAQAGRKNAVTIATNMAGRGTDIILGGNADAMAWAQLQATYPTRLDVPREEWDALVAEIEAREQTKRQGREVAAMGGLHIVGTERHEARRIDLQLRGRCGRQGDPGSSRFYLSLEDDLMRIFAGEWVKNVLTRLGMQEGEAIESRLVSRRIEGAQKKVEERNFEIRKNLLEYDEVMDEQRKRVYAFRQSLLDGASGKDMLLKMVDEQTNQHLGEFLDKDYGAESFARWAGKQLKVELDARDFRGMDFEQAKVHALDVAERAVESDVLDALEENLPPDAETDEWNWEALARFMNTRWELNLRDRDLRKLSREDLSEMLIQKAREAVVKIDLSDGTKLLDPDFGILNVCGWAKFKFGLSLDPAELKNMEPAAIKETVRRQAHTAYDTKERHYPVLAALYHFTTRDATGHKRYDREGLALWAQDRFQVTLDVEDLKRRQKEEIVETLVAQSTNYSAPLADARAEVARWIGRIFDNQDTPSQALRAARQNGQLAELAEWVKQDLGGTLVVDEVVRLDRQQLEYALNMLVEDRFRPEMRRMERAVLLELVDSAWKEHLLTMDHLRSSIGLRGYAQVDPKVEYKREGMRIFEQMWKSIAERATDLVFRMEQLDESFVGSTWTGATARHDEAPSTSDIGQQQQDAIEGTQADQKPEPIRIREERVGRNDPCPCGSGKKFKACCMRKGNGASPKTR